jgi:hypothetical protein
MLNVRKVRRKGEKIQKIATKNSCISSQFLICFLYEGSKLSKKEKLARRLRSRPSDFTFEELTALLGHLGYSLEKAGKTGGSRVAFANQDGDYIRLHKPHPRNTLKLYQIDDIVTNLAEKGLL